MSYKYVIQKLEWMSSDASQAITEVIKSQGKGMDNNHLEHLYDLRRAVEKELLWFTNQKENSI